jgi:hypothetical protein
MGGGIEVVAFRCAEAFVYTVPPARSAGGHRAGDWDVDHWLKKVSCMFCTTSGGDEDEADGETAGLVRLNDLQGGELFAECPLPADVPIAACVEPAVDSSRYYVLRLVDTASGRYAFLGLGFASRDESADFRVALAELSAQRERSREARRRRLAHEDGGTGAGAGVVAAPPSPARDYSLGDKIALSLPSLKKKSEATFCAPAGTSPLVAPSIRQLPLPSLAGLSLAPLPLLPPPPTSPLPAAAPHPPPLAAAADAFQASSVADDPFGDFIS